MCMNIRVYKFINDGCKPCTPTQLAREFDCNAQSISTWVAHAAADRGKPARSKDGSIGAER